MSCQRSHRSYWQSPAPLVDRGECSMELRIIQISPVLLLVYCLNGIFE
jgi:hypothetical protein